MRARVPVPGRGLIAVGVAILLVAAAAPALPAVGPVLWRAAILLVALLLAVDFLVRPRRGAVSVARGLQPVYHVGRRGTYRVRVRNDSDRALVVTLREALPPELEGEDVTLRLTLGPGEEVEREIAFVGLRRGRHALPRPSLRVAHPFGLLEYQESAPLDERVTVAPGRPAGETEWLLTRAALIEELGEKRSRKRGADREFESIREYVVGDEPRRVDWRASARRLRPMVRQYQTERNAEVILALDCGRLMGSLIGGIPKLDLAMTPVLDLAAVALRRKERVGFLAFDSAPRAFVPPRGGIRHLASFQSAIAALPEPAEPTSYLRAVRYLESRHRKRCLILVFTDFTDELTAREMEASLVGLTRRHVMVFVGVSDTHLEEIFDAERADLPSLFEKAVAGQLILERRRTLARMERLGVHTLDADPMRLSGPVIRKYLDLRRRGAV
jgi:uncharacterized protein (DUF58 family)